MRMAVLIKQVPATENIKIDEKTGTMIREGVEAELNPLDLHAVEEAVRLKERLGGEITVISMGPPAARRAIASAIAMGCDRGFLISDRKFAGSDTLATSLTLAAGVRKAGEFDLIFAGERATDGETGQVGPAVGRYLGASVFTYVSKVASVEGGRIVLERAVEGGHETVAAPLPALLCVVKEINGPRLCTLAGKMRARRTEIPLLDAASLGIPDAKLGLGGSPTKVVRVMYPQITRNGKIFSAADDPDGAVRAVFDLLREHGAIEEATSDAE